MSLSPITIQPNAVYEDGDIRLALGLTSTAMAKARRTGVLRFARQGNRTLYRGEWLLAWLDTVSARAEVQHA